MFDNKKRVYIALYDRTSNTTFHWSIVTIDKDKVDKDATSNRYHVTTMDKNNRLTTTWRYDDNIHTNLGHSKAIISLVRIGKIDPKKEEELYEIFKLGIPIIQNDTSWTCRVWVLEAIKLLQTNGIISNFNIDDLEKFCKEKATIDKANSLGKSFEEIQSMGTSVHKFV